VRWRFQSACVKTVASYFLVLLFSGSLLCAAGKSASPSAREGIAAANKAFEAAHLRGDAAALAAQYTESAQILWEDRPIIAGRKNIEAEWQKDMGGPGRKAKLTTLEIEESGDLAYETGKMLVTSPDGKVVYDGKYICIWKRENGIWKIHRDIGNKNAPAPSAN
jgi:ketosteroid isomerase-like protein